MNTIKTINQISNLTLRKWIVNPKIYILCFLMVSVIFYPFEDIARMLIAGNIDISPTIYPFFFLTMYFRIAITFGVVLLFCDAPFKTSEQLFVISRAGKNIWVYGQVLYIIKAMLTYSLFIFICTFFIFLPHTSYTADWGEGVLFLSNQPFAYLSFPIQIIENFTPFWAVLHTYFLNTLIGIFLALLMFWIGTITEKFVGMAIAVLLVLAPSMIQMFGTWFIWIVPTNLTALHLLDPYNTNTTLPPLWYAYIYLIALNVILVWLSVRATKNNLLGGAV